MNLPKKEQGFTLIELLVVISIISLLASVVLASFNGVRQKSAKAAGLRFSASTYNIMGDQAIGVWDFDECTGSTTIDKSGTGNMGTLRNGASWSLTTPTGIGCSVSLDGTDDDVFVSTDEISDIEGSVFAWAYPTATGINRYVFQGNSDSGTNRLYLQWNDGNFMAIRGNPAAVVTIKAGALLNTWHHIGLSWKNGVMNAYYDGAFVGTGSFTPIGSGWATSYIGRQDPSGKNFPGLVDEVRVYSRSLTAREVRNLYASGEGRTALARKP